jgi:hypothetical protein
MNLSSIPPALPPAATAKPLRRGRTLPTLGPLELAKPLEEKKLLIPALGIGPGAVTLIAGYGFSRKTLFSQALALDIATGSWCIGGAFRCVRGNVLHVDFEQGERLTSERYQRLARAKNIDLASLDPASLRVASLPAVFVNDSDAESVFARAAENCRLVVLDSLRASVPGADENSSDIRRHLDVLSRISEKTGAAIVIIHHARKPPASRGGEPPSPRYAIRGSGSLYDACASVFIFSGEKGEPTRVSHEKCRNVGTLHDDFFIESRDVEIGGNPRAGLAIEFLTFSEVASRSVTPDPASSYEQAKAKIFEAVAKEGGVFRGTRESLQAALGLGSRTFRPALAACESEGRIEVRRTKAGVEILLVGGPYEEAK